MEREMKLFEEVERILLAGGDEERVKEIRGKYNDPRATWEVYKLLKEQIARVGQDELPKAVMEAFGRKKEAETARQMALRLSIEISYKKVLVERLHKVFSAEELATLESCPCGRSH